MSARAAAGEKQRGNAVVIHVRCWRGCGRLITVEPDRYSSGLVCGECWDE